MSQNENPVENFSHSEDLVKASEVLRADIGRMHDSSVELTERATVNPLDVTEHEYGTTLGLTEEEISRTLVPGGYEERDAELCSKAQALHRDFLARLTQSARIGVVAFAIGSSARVPAEDVMTTPDLQFEEKRKE